MDTNPTYASPDTPPAKGLPTDSGRFAEAFFSAAVGALLLYLRRGMLLCVMAMLKGEKFDPFDGHPPYSQSTAFYLDLWVFVTCIGLFLDALVLIINRGKFLLFLPVVVLGVGAIACGAEVVRLRMDNYAIDLVSAVTAVLGIYTFIARIALLVRALKRQP